MEKKTIGQFIAALRKANGMTQQDVADKLNVSNKAVSRWERDECAPDIMLIPALAEMFGVTCDELLKGERITYTMRTEKSEPKVEKQLKALVSRTLMGFKTLIWIAFAVSLVGLVCMFGISYGLYRPIIGFFIMCLFEVCAFGLVALAVSRTKDVKAYNELLEHAEASLSEAFDTCLCKYSFHGFFMIFSVVALSLPLICFRTDYIESVLVFEDYLIFAVGIAFLLILVYLKGKDMYWRFLIGDRCDKKTQDEEALKEEEASLLEKAELSNKRIKRMNLIQIGAIVLAGLLFFVAPYFEVPRDVSPVAVGLVIGGILSSLTAFVSFVVFLVKYKNERSSLWLPGIRNLLLVVSSYLMAGVHSFYWTIEAGDTTWVSGEIWHMEYMYYALGWVLVVVVAFEVVERLSRKKK